MTPAQAVVSDHDGVLAAPEDIAHAVAFFANEGAGFVSGQVLDVVGGPRA